MLLVNDFKVRMRAYVYSLTLVIKVGAPDNPLKVSRSVFSRPKHLPARSVLGQIFGLSGLERNQRNRASRRVRRGQARDEFDDALQGTTVVLVVSKQLGLGVCGFAPLPAISPQYALQSCGVFMSTLGPKKATNVLEAIRISWEVNVGMDH